MYEIRNRDHFFTSTSLQKKLGPGGPPKPLVFSISDEEEDKRTVREFIEKLIPRFSKEKRGKAKKVLHQLVAESKVISYSHKKNYFKTNRPCTLYNMTSAHSSLFNTMYKS